MRQNLCMNCGIPGAKPCCKTSVLDFKQEKALLCARCRDKLGWSRPLGSAINFKRK